MKLREDIAGAILAGGRSSRMGQNKALLGYRGTTLIGQVAAALRDVVGHVMVIADDGAAYAFLGAPVHPDVFTGCGPLAGIHSALVHSPSAATLIVSCDLPLVTPAELRAIIAAHDGDVTIPSADGDLQPLCGVYGRRFLGVAEECLRAGRYRVTDALKDPRVRLRRLAMGSAGGALASINTPEQYRQLCRNDVAMPPAR